MKLLDITPLLNVENFQKSVDFYTKHLGFHIDAQFPPENPGWARIVRDNIRMMINTPQNSDSAARRKHTAYSDLVLALHVPDTPEAYAELVAAGVDVGEVSQEEYGREILLKDPDGYQLSISDDHVPKAD